MRADQLLVERGLASSRAQAQRLIGAGAQWLGPTGWTRIAKNSDELDAGVQLQLLDTAEARYVSRGGLKLEGALKATGIDVHGLQCLDVGQSTGGFTDCMLRHGAARVVGVDVGHGQLHPSLRADRRVLAIEGVNARSLRGEDLWRAHAVSAGAAQPFDARFGLVCGDLSFISLTLVLPALVPLLAPGGTLLMLVKPQFELQPGQLGKGGIVRDAALHAQVERRIRDCCAGLGLRVLGWYDSAITGGDGNHEFFIHAMRESDLAKEKP